NNWQGLYKLSYKPRNTDKFFVSYNKSLAVDQGFGRHLVSDIADNRNTYPYRWSRRLDHAAVDVDDNATLASNWTHVFGTNLVQPMTGVAYLRDRIDYEGFVADVGLRWDLYIPGREAEDAVANLENFNISPTVRQGFLDGTFKFPGLFGLWHAYRAKGHVSPR